MDWYWEGYVAVVHSSCEAHGHGWVVVFSGDDGDDRTTIKMIELIMLMNRLSGQAMQGC